MTVSRSESAGARRTSLRPAPPCRAGTAAAPSAAGAPQRRAGKRMARAAAAAFAVAALAAGGVTQRAGLTASFAVLGHLRWLCIPAAIVLESVSMAAFAIMLRRLLAAGGASVGVRPMLATAYAANAVSVSVPLAGPGLATGFIFAASPGRARMPRWPAGHCWPAGWPPRPPRPSSWSAAGWRPGKSWSQRSPCPAACSP
jgi:hypothetical protein